MTVPKKLTLLEIRAKNHGEYTSPATGVPLYTARDVEDWLKQWKSDFVTKKKYYERTQFVLALLGKLE